MWLRHSAVPLFAFCFCGAQLRQMLRGTCNKLSKLEQNLFCHWSAVQLSPLSQIILSREEEEEDACCPERHIII